MGLAEPYLILREGRLWKASLSDVGEALGFIYLSWDVSLGAIYQKYSH